ncbi:redoxin domain-containing protein, partial [Soehngenia saccharolytica]
LLVSPDRDFVIGKGGKKVPISELVGKTVCLYFSAHWCPPCRGFTPKLIKFYNDLKSKGEDLEIVFISSDRDAETFDEYFGSMPWLALPFRDRQAKYLGRYFEIGGIPTLIVLGPDGKTLQTEAVELVLEHGVEVYPFTKEKLDELKAKEEAIRAAQTLESLLVSDERNFVITNGGGKVPVSELTGKTVGLYFSAHWCPPCRAFTPKLAQVYNKLKENREAFEIVFLSSDKDQESFDEYYASMPWLALPFGDKVKKDLSRYFRIKSIPSLLIIGPDGKTVTTDGKNIVSVHGAKAYPFTDARLIELQKEKEAAAE